MEASITPAITPPSLLISSIPGSKVVVSWPSWAETWELQASSAIAGAPWTVINSGIYLSDTGMDFVWTNAVAPGSKAFFRLQHIQ